METEELVLLTHDSEFEDIQSRYRGIVIISRVRQSLPIQQRVALWTDAIEGFLSKRPSGKLFDLLEDGTIVPWKIHETDEP